MVIKINSVFCVRCVLTHSLSERLLLVLFFIVCEKPLLLFVTRNSFRSILFVFLFLFGPPVFRLLLLSHCISCRAAAHSAKRSFVCFVYIFPWDDCHCLRFAFMLSIFYLNFSWNTKIRLESNARLAMKLKLTMEQLISKIRFFRVLHSFAIDCRWVRVRTHHANKRKLNR